MDWMDGWMDDEVEGTGRKNEVTEGREREED